MDYIVGGIDMKVLKNKVLQLVDETGNLSETKVFAYKDSKGKEFILSNQLYLGKNDDGSRYYEVDKPKENITENEQENK